MEANKEEKGILDLMIRPGFCVTDNLITEVNQAAASLLIVPGTDVRDLILVGREEYAVFSGGCLYLHLNIFSESCGVTVVRMDGKDYFLLDQQSDDDALRAMALAARELREPLTSMMLSSRQLKAACEKDAEELARLSRGMHQMLRILGNMSDAGNSTPLSSMEIRDIPAVLAGIFEKAQALVSQAGMTLEFQSTVGSILGLADEASLERAILNILSNAIKFSPKGGTIRAQLSLRGRMLALTILDNGSGIAGNLQNTLFQRYLRQPGIEDSRFGLGLGMVLVRNTAHRHGGTILIDQPESGGTRVCMTLAIRQDAPSGLHSPILRVDYSGEQDHGLVELADCLPLSAYYQN